MAREVFPYDSDREVITRFLEGALTTGRIPSDTMSISDGALRCAQYAVAYFDTGGSLVGTPAESQHHTTYDIRVINEILDQLGDKDTRLVRDVEMGVDENMVSKWYLGDQPVTPGVPFVICGPLSIQAWRASRGVKFKKR